MVIAEVTPVYPPYRGGMGSVAEAYAQAARASGLTVEIFSPRVSGLRPWWAWGNAALVPQLVWRLRTVDLIHLHYPFYGGDFFAALSAFIFQKPLLVTYHMRTRGSGWLGLLFRLQRWLLEPFIFAVAQAILVSSLDYAKASGLASKKLIELPFGVDTDRFFPGRDDDWRRAHAIPLDRTVILFVGGLDDAHGFKGVAVLLRACAMLNAPSWQLLIIGDGNRKKTFEEQARTLGIGDRVTFAGSVHFDDLPRAYRAADLHVLPSTDGSEAFGLVTLEAAASGLPSIVSNLPGARTIIEPKVTGLTVPPGVAAALAEAIEKLLQQSDQRLAFGLQARARAMKHYDQKLLAEKLNALYKSPI